MKKVTIFIGSPRKQATYQAVQEFEKNLRSYAEMEFEYVYLKDYHLEYCKGCNFCYTQLFTSGNGAYEVLNGTVGIYFTSATFFWQGLHSYCYPGYSRRSFYREVHGNNRRKLEILCG